MSKNFLRAIIEIGFIIFLFYSNLLMGEFEHSGVGKGRTLIWALHDIFTFKNFGIALIAAVIGFMVVEVLRQKLLR